MFLQHFNLVQLVLSIPAIVIAFVFHEFAHAAMAVACGDETPRRQGRLTLEPLAHLDWLGTFCLLFVGFGWAKPVQTQPANYKDRFWGEVLVSSAGVLMNLVLAFVFAIITGLFEVRGTLHPMLGQALIQVIWFNLVLVVFNLLPVPPLDGWHVVRALMPARVRFTLGAQIERFGPFLLLLLIATPVVSSLIGPPLLLLNRWVYVVARAVTGLA